MQQTETDATNKPHASNPKESQTLIDSDAQTNVTTTAPGEYRVIRRNGKITSFDVSKISVAMTKAFLAVEGGQAAASRRIREKVANLTQDVLNGLFRRLDDGGTIHIEDIQDQVELALMRAGEHKVARDYVLYRAKQAEKRAKNQAKRKKKDQGPKIYVIGKDGSKKLLDGVRLKAVISESVTGLSGVDKELILKQAYRNIFDGIAQKDLNSAIIMCARQYIEKDPSYSKVAARLLLDGLRTEVLSFLFNEEKHATQAQMQELYPQSFNKYIHKAVELELLSPELCNYDLDMLGAAIKPERDHNFTYLGFQTLYDRYFIHHGDSKIELPQSFFMRVSMGLAINEVDREEKAIEFYNLLSSFDFMSSTPTLFNSGTLRPQLSSCYLTTVPDDLEGIFNAIKDDALLSKYAGGLGNDWSRVRGMGSRIKGTNGESQGVVPFLKVANDTAVAVNQGGKRKGAMCAYLETWHIDIEEFLDLRKNTGDERRRTHDMNTANWIPDLFMERVASNGKWTLFSPEETPELHELYGQAFCKKYEYYEQKAQAGELRNTKQVNANDLWRKMLGMLFETGHPWITFKDPCNIRSPQQHVGVVHSSNLCTEITLNTTDDEIAVCNLGSVNLPQHISKDGLDYAKLERTITTAMRMLDNVIDYNFYSVPQARRSNLRHRPVGIGLMGFQDALYKQNIAYSSEEAVKFADISMEAISYFAISASSDLAKDRGSYPTYAGSLWSQGILPIDSIELLEKERGKYMQQDKSSTMDWAKLRAKIKTHGMRNSNTMAIAPTATISNISGVSQSIEPIYQNLFVKSNLSGEFTIVNPYLVQDFKALDIWDEVMINDLKYFDGSVQKIDRVPDNLKQKYATAFEVDAGWLIEAASRRQKWIDQGQSLNIYMEEASGKKMDAIYKLAWVKGLKTTYYLRSLGATQAEKGVEESSADKQSAGLVAPAACSILDPDCDACQ
ncbi:Ribonucleotide reductase of class Ia (aerobic), alpha subunit [hydrothermal vent metagenome]|uniref:ribonucleoside-diphosphate reductase n=1 Tax=hydrothermal vent metagenome TaxID=652676 RepID=A0A3B0VLV2_9ZZZZ